MPGPLKKAIFYCIPYMLFIALAELTLYLIFVIQDQQTCIDKWTTYGYCAGYSEVRDLSREKQDYTKVYVYTDELGGRQPGPEPSVFPEQSRVFIIGDSFVQADELSYELTMAGVLNANAVPAYALGYSSWNPIQYAGAIKKLGGLKGEYHVFMFFNDFAPDYERSVAGEVEPQIIEEEFWARLKGISRLATLIDQKWKKIAASRKASVTASNSGNQYQALVGDRKFSFARAAFRQCQHVDAVWDHSEMSDLLIFAKHYSCWPKEFRRKVDMGVDAIAQLVDYFLANVDGDVHLYLIPAGWALPNQNSAGRAYPSLGIPKATTVSQVGLVNYLQYRGLDVMDLEPFLQDQLDSMAVDCGECQDMLYFENDGHWTGLTNRLVALELLK